MIKLIKRAVYNRLLATESKWAQMHKRIRDLEAQCARYPGLVEILDYVEYGRSPVEATKLKLANRCPRFKQLRKAESAPGIYCQTYPKAVGKSNDSSEEVVWKS